VVLDADIEHRSGILVEDVKSVLAVFDAMHFLVLHRRSSQASHEVEAKWESGSS